MIKNIIFDWGGVLIHLDKKRCTEAFARLGVEVSDELTNPYGQRADLMDFEKGLMTVPEFHDTVRRVYGAHLTDGQIDEAWSALLLDIPEYKLDVLLELKKSYRLFLLSNTNAVHWEEGRKRFDYRGHRAEDFFERIFLSHEIHELKPTPEAFLKVAQLAGIEPTETLFVDDLEVSCKAAEALGFKTYCPVPNTDWRGKLRIE
jgi:putative hydrolase of the HAD superfamily